MHATAAFFLAIRLPFALITSIIRFKSLPVLEEKQLSSHLALTKLLYFK